MKVTGVVEAKSNNFGKFSVKVGDNWYSSKFEIPCSTGDSVEFDSGPTGKYCQKLKVVGGGAPKVAAGKVVGQEASNRDRSIIRQNALAHATRVICDGPDMYDIYSEIDSATRAETMADDIIKIAKKFEAYAAGDNDRVVVRADGPDVDFVEA